MKPKNYLLSFPIPQIGVVFHAYCISNDQAGLRDATVKLVEVTEENVQGPYMEMILVTPLEAAGRRTVRAHVGKNPEAKKMMEEATDFHLTIWAMAAADPDCKKLMELH